MTRHIVMGIAKVLEWEDDALEKFFGLPSATIRKELTERLAAGEKYIGSENCEGFDPVKGCPGHPDENKIK